MLPFVLYQAIPWAPSDLLDSIEVITQLLLGNPMVPTFKPLD
jgi:hypothetical protein